MINLLQDIHYTQNRKNQNGGFSHYTRDGFGTYL